MTAVMPAIPTSAEAKDACIPNSKAVITITAFKVPSPIPQVSEGA